ncbi:MAG: hypothetical protein ABIW79_11530, partial [Gemmatimonas sp.]
ASAVVGASTTVPLTITRTNFTGDVAIAVTGLPTGVTATLNPASPLGAAVNATTLTLSAGATAVAGTSNITITASGTGVTAQTQSVALTVTAAATPGFTLSAAPATVTATAGAGGTSTVTLARTGGFTSDVALTVTGAPAGVTATLAPTTMTGAIATSTLTLASTAATIPGTYNLVVRGNSAGQAERTTTVAFTVNAAPGITIGLTPAAISVVTGTTGTSNIALTRAGGFTGDVTLAATGLPAGTTITFAPTSFTGAGSTSAATFTVGAATAPGTYNVVITGTGTGGSLVSSQTLALTVTAAQGITVAATNATAAQGATATSNITLTRAGGFAGAVTLAVSGLPVGVTPTFNPQSVTGTTSTLSLAIGATVVPNTYTGTITASGTGVTNATTTFTLTVTTAGTGGGNIAFRYCDVSDIPSFFAYRNGTSGAWLPVTISGNNTFTVNLTGGPAQIVTATPNSSGGADVSVLLLAASEAAGFANQACLSNPASKTVTGTVAGLAAGQQAVISLGGGGVTVNANGPFTITNANASASDLIAVRQSVNASTFITTVDRVIVRRNVNPVAGGSIGATLDFGSAEAVLPASAAYTVAGVATGEQVIVSNTFQTTNGGTSAFPSSASLFGAFSNPVTVFGVPSSLTQAGDFNGISVLAFGETGAQTTFRSIVQYNRDIAARTISLGANLTAPTFATLATTPYARIRATGSFPAEYPDFLTVGYSQNNGQRDWTIFATRAYLGAASSYELEIPDLSGVAGFQNAWGLVAGVLTDYTFAAYSGFQGLTSITEGSTVKFAGRTGQITP